MGVEWWAKQRKIAITEALHQIIHEFVGPRLEAFRQKTIEIAVSNLIALWLCQALEMTFFLGPCQGKACNLRFVPRWGSLTTHLGLLKCILCQIIGLKYAKNYALSKKGGKSWKKPLNQRFRICIHAP